MATMRDYNERKLAEAFQNLHVIIPESMTASQGENAIRIAAIIHIHRNVIVPCTRVFGDVACLYDLADNLGISFMVEFGHRLWPAGSRPHNAADIRDAAESYFFRLLLLEMDTPAVARWLAAWGVSRSIRAEQQRTGGLGAAGTAIVEVIRSGRRPWG